MPNGRKILHRLYQLGPEALIPIGLFFMLLIAFIDYLTGFELSIAFFYVLPVALVTWFVNRRSGFILAVACALAWYASNTLAGATYSSPLIPFWNTVSRLVYLFIVSALLSEVRIAYEKERQSSRTDFLTGALNSRAFYEVLKSEIQRSQRHASHYILAYFDIDNFKQVNDLFGHSVGDDLLRCVVETMKANLRTTDIVARLGGDEFAILLHDSEPDSSANVIGRLRLELINVMQVSNWPVTFSIGVMVCSHPLESADDCIRQVDEVMYRVKNNGKNAIEVLIH
jgi:diguanylate cyclase (GGDEF)-like protein